MNHPDDRSGDLPSRSDKQQPTPRTAAVDFAEYQHQSDYMVALRNLARQLERETLAWGAAVFKACGNRHTSTPDEVDAAVAAHVKHHVEGAAIPSSTAIAPSTLADKWPGERPKETDAEINAGALRQPRLLQDIKYEMQRVMMGARWDRPSWKRLIERMDEALAKPVSATASLPDPVWWTQPIHYDKDRGYFLDARGTLVAVARVAVSDAMNEMIAEKLSRP